MIKKWIAVGIILILLCSSTPIFGTIPSLCPHVHFSGKEGLNGWYVSGVFVTIDSSAWFQIDNGSWEVYTAPFAISNDGRHLLVATGYYNGSNWTEEYHINIDQTIPIFIVSRTVSLSQIIFIANCSDHTSGVNRIEFYMNGILRETDVEEPYEWTYFYDTMSFTLTGIIKKPQFSEENITIPVLVGVISYNQNLTFKAICYDNAGNKAFCEPDWSLWPSVFWVLSKTLVLPNNYSGHVGWFFVHATFYN